MVELGGEVLPIEIKSGKDYTKHAALSNVLASEEYAIPAAYVFHNGNVKISDNVTYYPIYMLMFIQKGSLPQDLIYELNLDGLI